MAALSASRRGLRSISSVWDQPDGWLHRARLFACCGSAGFRWGAGDFGSLLHGWTANLAGLTCGSLLRCGLHRRFGRRCAFCGFRQGGCFGSSISSPSALLGQRDASFRGRAERASSALRFSSRCGTRFAGTARDLSAQFRNPGVNLRLLETQSDQCSFQDFLVHD